jgi:hypothetical protein
VALVDTKTPPSWGMMHLPDAIGRIGQLNLLP